MAAAKIVFRNDGPFWSASHLLLVKELLVRHPECELVWLAGPDRRLAMPAPVKTVSADSHEAGEHLKTAGVVFDYLGRDSYPRPGKKQFYLLSSDRNCWFEEYISNLDRALKAARKAADFIITGGRFETGRIERRFKSSLPVYEFGHPVNALLAPGRNGLDAGGRDSLVKGFKEKFNLPDGLKIVLFDPDESRDCDFEKIRAALGRRFGGDWLAWPLGRNPGRSVEAFPPAEFNDLDKLGAILAAEAAVTSARGFAAESLLAGTPCFFYASTEAGQDTLGIFCRYFGYPLASNENELLGHIGGYDAAADEWRRGATVLDRLGRSAGRPADKLVGLVESLLRHASDPARIYCQYGARETDKALWRAGPFRWVLKKFLRLPAASRRLALQGLMKAVLGLCRLWPIKENKIVFLSTHSLYACNPKYIIQEIIRRNLDLELVFLGDVRSRKPGAPWLGDAPEKLRLVNRRPWPRFAFELSTAKVWIDNVVRNLPPKRAGQFFIQTWHGSLGIKRLLGEHREKVWERHRLMTDFCISNSAWETEVIYRSNHWPCLKILEYGHPRNDILCPGADRERQRQAKSKVYKFFNLEPEEKIVLYAPTFRERHLPEQIGLEAFSPESLACYRPDPDLLLSALSKKFKGRWRFLFRLHPAIKKIGLGNDLFSGPAAVDASAYHDMQELMVAAEVLISDYSSCLFDFMLTRRPAFVFAADMAEYENERGFFYPLNSTPFPIAESSGELARVILNFDPARYQEAVAGFLADKGSRDDGRAARRVADLVEMLAAPGRGRGFSGAPGDMKP